MNRIFLCIAVIMILAGLVTGSSGQVGEIGSIDTAKNEIIINMKSGINLRMGDLLEIKTDSGKIVLEVIYPMQTVARCTIKGNGKVSRLSKGIPVYRYRKPVDENDRNTAGKSGMIETFGKTEMVFINGGTFMMGSHEIEDGRENDESQHKVTVSSFWIGKYEVTCDEYDEIMGIHLYATDEKKPVSPASWYIAVEYCNELSRKYKLNPYYKIDVNSSYPVTVIGGNGFRLPTEAEWEYACRAGTATSYYWGDEVKGNYCWYAGNSANISHPVGKKKPNRFGLYDMSGNLEEYCYDWYSEDYYMNSSLMDPMGPKGGLSHVVRGGSFAKSWKYQRSAARSKDSEKSDSNINIGIRVARSIN